MLSPVTGGCRHGKSGLELRRFEYLASVKLINVLKVTFMGMCTFTKDTCPGFCVSVVYSLALFSNPKSTQGGPSNTGVM